MILTAYLFGFCVGFVAAIVSAIWVCKARENNQ